MSDEPLCGDPTCEGPGCRQSAIDAWYERQEKAARDLVWGGPTYVADNRTYCAECNSQLAARGHAKGCRILEASR